MLLNKVDKMLLNFDQILTMSMKFKFIKLANRCVIVPQVDAN